MLLTALLYFALSCVATHHALAQGWQWPQPQKPPTVQEPEQPPSNTAPEEPPTNTVPEEPPTITVPIEERPVMRPPHIGVVLPLQSRAYGRFAEQVRLGILNASNMAAYNSLPVTVYSTTEDTQHILDAYQQATREGARAIIGPLTRDAVSAVARQAFVAVPTVALNVPDTGISLPPNMYVFGLQIEAEAEQVASLAFSRGGRKALIVVADNPLGRRIATAFSRQWKAKKGDIADEFVYSTDPTNLASLRELMQNTAADVIFLALNAPRARFIRTYLGTDLPIYATSLVYASKDKLELYDLNGVRFMDMPWLLQEDHPAVMTYLQAPQDTGALDEERFYALGIDAYRIVQALLEHGTKVPTIDGVTGTIKLNTRQHFTHELTPAYFSYGVAHVLPEGTDTKP